MKKIALIMLVVYTATFINPTRSEAAVPLVVLGGAAIATVAIGAGVAAGVKYYQQTGENPLAGAWAAAQTSAYQNYVWLKAYQGVLKNLVTPASFPNAQEQLIGAAGWVGASLGDLYDYSKNAAAGTVDSLKNLFNQYTSTGDYTSLVSGQIITEQGKNWRIGNSPVSGWITLANYAALTGLHNFADGRTYTIEIIPNNSEGVLMVYDPRTAVDVNGGYKYKTWLYGLYVTNSAATALPGQPGVDWQGIKDKLVAQPNVITPADLAKAIQGLQQALVQKAGAQPTTADPKPAEKPITQQDIQNFLQQNYNEVQNIANTIINNPASTAQEIAAAENAAEQAKEETEKYSPVTNTGFAEAYNPGQFNIPQRFTQFITNVKSSSLFSFSSNFFNSLPAGGSPIYTIDAGSYGIYTVNLEETLGSGLSILKKVLLVVFGFLSIRAIIMKR